jgi:hypothetical protein
LLNPSPYNPIPVSTVHTVLVFVRGFVRDSQRREDHIGAVSDQFWRYNAETVSFLSADN